MSFRLYSPNEFVSGPELNIWMDAFEYVVFTYLDMPDKML